MAVRERDNDVNQLEYTTSKGEYDVVERITLRHFWSRTDLLNERRIPTLILDELLQVEEHIEKQSHQFASFQVLTSDDAFLGRLNYVQTKTKPTLHSITHNLAKHNITSYS